MLFTHTCFERERGLWRGWLRDGQTLEISWPRKDSGLKVTFHGAQRFLWVGLVLVQFFIPIGLVKNEWLFGDEPQWGFTLSREFGIILRWGSWRKQWDWPFHTITLAWDYLGKDGDWHNNHGRSFENFSSEVEKEDSLKKTETYPYRYVLKSGGVQNVTATISKERWIRGRHILSWLGLWPSRVSYSINVQFDGEVGEEAGSWKGGCVGCGYSMKPGETPLDTLRRMERERKFD